MTQEEKIARAIYAVVYGLGSDRSFLETQPIYRGRCFEAAQKVLEIIEGGSGTPAQPDLLAESQLD